MANFSGPSNLVFKRFHKLKLKLNHFSTRLFCPKSGDHALQALSNGNLKPCNIETARVLMRRATKKKAFIKINVYPYASITKRPTGARMGKGKGKHFAWISPIYKGKILYEVSITNYNRKLIAPSRFMKKIVKKMPFRSRYVRLIY